MRRIFVFSLVFYSVTFLALCASSPARDSTQQRITINVSDTPLRNALETICKNIGFNYVLEQTELGEIKVTAYTKDAPLETVLKMLLKAAGADYRLEDSVIVVFSNPEAQWNRIVNVEARNERLVKVLPDLFKNTGLSYTTHSSVNDLYVSSVRISNIPLESALKTLLSVAGAEYRVEDGVVIIYRKGQDPDQQSSLGWRNEVVQLRYLSPEYALRVLPHLRVGVHSDRNNTLIITTVMQRGERYVDDAVRIIKELDKESNLPRAVRVRLDATIKSNHKGKKPVTHEMSLEGVGAEREPLLLEIAGSNADTTTVDNVPSPFNFRAMLTPVVVYSEAANPSASKKQITTVSLSGSGIIAYRLGKMLINMPFRLDARAVPRTPTTVAVGSVELEDSTAEMSIKATVDVGGRVLPDERARTMRFSRGQGGSSGTVSPRIGDLTLELSTPASSFRLGEPIPYELKITNTSDRYIRFDGGIEDRMRAGSPLKANCYVIEVLGEDGEPVPPPEVPKSGAGSQQAAVPPGQAILLKGQINNWAAFSQPGTYQVRALWKLSEKGDPIAESKPITLEIKPGE
ncbi:MAG: hypothetical protein HYX78_02985 [Armatimonadetes bacterium]|nr:hypothetical protein [Armatimonadota bacterium]